MKHHISCAALVLVGTLAISGVQAQEKNSPDDAMITQRVEQMLAKDHMLRQVGIRVETHGAVVRLTGVVRSVDEIGKAGMLARKVRGVSSVTNKLRLDDRPSRG